MSSIADVVSSADLLDHILIAASAETVVCKAALVCRFWRAAAQRQAIWKAHCLRRWSDTVAAIRTQDYRALYKRLYLAEHHERPVSLPQGLQDCMILFRYPTGPMMPHGRAPAVTKLLDAATLSQGELFSVPRQLLQDDGRWPPENHRLLPSDTKDALALPAPGLHAFFRSLFVHNEEDLSAEDAVAMWHAGGYADPFDAYAHQISVTLVSKLDGRVVQLSDPLEGTGQDQWDHSIKLMRPLFINDLSISTLQIPDDHVFEHLKITFYAAEDQLFLRLYPTYPDSQFHGAPLHWDHQVGSVLQHLSWTL